MNKDIDFKTFTPKENDVIVIQFDASKTSFYEARDIHKFVQGSLPNNKVIILPSTNSFNVFTKNQVKDMLQSLMDFLDSDNSENCQ